MGIGRWRTILRKNGGDRRLSWRVVGMSAGGRAESTPSELTWDEQVMSAGAPNDGYSVAAGERVRFLWGAPSIALKPRVAISATGDFDDTQRVIYLTAAPGAHEAVLGALKLGRLIAMDDGDKVVYWRVEDAMAAVTTVRPSETKTLHLP